MPLVSLSTSVLPPPYCRGAYLIALCAPYLNPAMMLFQHPDFDHHEQVVFHHDADTGLRALIAIHSTRLGPSLGGCRMVPYADELSALTDVLRLSRAMSYKAAMAELPQGGGKSVIIGDPRQDKTPALMRAMGRGIDRLGGAYIVAEDSGTDVDDMAVMAGVTRHVSGLTDPDTRAAGRSGDPSPATAYGTLVSIRTVARRLWGRESLQGLHVAIQGVGAVGYRLAALLHAEGAVLTVADTHGPAVARCVQAFAAQAVPVEAIHAVPADIFSPCALGGAITHQALTSLAAAAVVGAANNPLADARLDEALRQRGVLYAPDFIVNAGGIIDIHHQRIGYDAKAVRAHLDRIGVTLEQVLTTAQAHGRGTAAVAIEMARQRMGR